MEETDRQIPAELGLMSQYLEGPSRLCNRCSTGYWAEAASSQSWAVVEPSRLPLERATT